MRRTYAVMATVLVLGLVAATMKDYISNLLPYSASSFSGDGTIRDSGFWAYPRYEILFAESPLNSAGKYAYSVRGLPSQLTFCLRVSWHADGTSVSAKEATLRELTSSANVKIRIADDSGNVVCEQSSRLSDWELSISAGRAEYWHPECRDLSFRRGCLYTIAIQIDCDDTTVEKVMALPILYGGGNELP